MNHLECTIFNVEHGFCAFIKSPNNYGLMIDCGSRSLFSPLKWVRANYNYGNRNITYHKGRRIAEMVITHLHADHFDDIGSFQETEDQPWILLRDKKTMKYLDEKIEEEEEGVEVLRQFKKFQSIYTEDVKDKVDWGFEFSAKAITFPDAEAVSASRDNVINNRSFIVGIEYAGKKILIPGDIEEEGWEKAFKHESIRKILSGTNFFVVSHHGHRSGRHPDMVDYTGKPDIFIVSAKRGDGDTDYDFYCDRENSYGYTLYEEGEPRHMISTKTVDRSIRMVIDEYGRTAMGLIKIPNNLNQNQKRLRARRTARAVRDYVYAR